MDPSWLDAVVRIMTGPSLCAGVVISPTEVATAYHCVTTGMRPMVQSRTGDRWIGRTTAADPGSDLAIITVNGMSLPTRPVRTGPVEVAESVWAIGHPFGTAASGKYDGLLDWSVSRGIVSASNDWYVQTDAPVNPGNSGGPLLDVEGRLIGIASRKMVGDGVAFYARTDRLEALRAEPTPLSPIGGTMAVGLSFLQDRQTWILADGQFSFRERVVLRVDVGLGTEAGQGRVGSTLSLRQRVGRGTWSTVFDAGGGVRHVGVFEPIVGGRVGVRGLGFGVELVPGTWAWTLRLDLGWPGTLGVF